MKKRILLVIFTVFGFYLNTAESYVANEQSMAKDISFIPARPFSGVLVEYNRNNMVAKRATKLLLGKHGMRTETQPVPNNKAKIILINNYQTDQEWLVDPIRRVYSELSRESQVESSEDSTDDQSSLLGILANIPCAGLNGDKQSTRSIGESELSVWRCTDELGRAYLQHFSTLLGVVVRQETQDGWISELEDITLVEKSLDYFKPPNDYREVSLGELIMGKIELPDYVE